MYRNILGMLFLKLGVWGLRDFDLDGLLDVLVGQLRGRLMG